MNRMDKFLEYLTLREQLKQKRDEVWAAAKDAHTYVRLGYLECVDNEFQLTAKSKRPFASAEQSDFATAAFLAKEKLELVLVEEEELMYRRDAAWGKVQWE